MKKLLLTLSICLSLAGSAQAFMFSNTCKITAYQPYSYVRDLNTNQVIEHFWGEAVMTVNYRYRVRYTGRFETDSGKRYVVTAANIEGEYHPQLNDITAFAGDARFQDGTPTFLSASWAVGNLAMAMYPNPDGYFMEAINSDRPESCTRTDDVEKIMPKQNPFPTLTKTALRPSVNGLYTNGLRTAP